MLIWKSWGFKMKKELITLLQNDFNSIANTLEDEQIEYWYARDLQKILDYEKWDKFQNVINKAKKACENSGIEVFDHFRQVGKMVIIGSGAKRDIGDIVLTRYACYLIAQNGDSSKEPIAFAQTYFAIQTRKQELLEQRIELEDRLQTRNKLKESETELSKNIYGENSITGEHIQNNESVRGLLVDRGIKPEELPPAEDLKKLERKVKSEDKKLIKKSALPKSKGSL